MIATFTTLIAASFKLLAGIISTLELDSMFLASSAFVPSSLTTTGTSKPKSLTASTTPLATRSHRTIPPKIFISIAFTFLSYKIILKPFLIVLGRY